MSAEFDLVPRQARSVLADIAICRKTTGDYPCLSGDDRDTLQPVVESAVLDPEARRALRATCAELRIEPDLAWEEGELHRAATEGLTALSGQELARLAVNPQMIRRLGDRIILQLPEAWFQTMHRVGAEQNRRAGVGESPTLEDLLASRRRQRRALPAGAMGVLAPGGQPDAKQRRAASPTPADCQIWADADWGVNLRSTFQELPRGDGLEIALWLENDRSERPVPTLSCRVRVECDDVIRFDEEVVPDSTVEIQVRPLAQVSRALWDLSDKQRSVQITHVHVPKAPKES